MIRVKKKEREMSETRKIKKGLMVDNVKREEK